MHGQTTKAAQQTRQTRLLHLFQEALDYLQHERWLDALVAFERYEGGVDSPPELFWNCALIELNKIRDVAYSKDNEVNISNLRNAIEKGNAEQMLSQK